MSILVPDIGPRFAAYGDPTANGGAFGAGMTDLSLVRMVDTSLDPAIKHGETVTGMNNLESRFFQGLDGTIELMIARDAVTGINRALEIVDDNGDFRKLGASLAKQTLVIIHPDDIAGTATTSAKTIYYPAVSLSDIGNTTYNANGDEADDGNFVTVTFKLGYIATDQNGDAVPEEAQPYTRGDRLATHSLAFTLPPPYGPAA